jgi:hypothetical protein
MNCEPIRGLLSAYLDDQLSVPERQSVAAHLDTCIKCSAILSDYYRFDALLAQLPYLTPPSSPSRNVLCQAPNRYRIQTLEERQKTVLTLVPLPLHDFDMQVSSTYRTYSTRPGCSIHPIPAPQDRINAKKGSRENIVILLLITTVGLLFLHGLYPRRDNVSVLERFDGRNTKSSV